MTLILPLELQMRIWVVRWAGWVTQAVKLLSLYPPSPDRFLGAEVGSLYILCIQHTSTYIHIHRLTFRNSKQLPCWKLLFPTEFFGFTESSFSQRRILSVKGGGKSCSGLLISHGPDGLCEVARNDHKIIFHFCALNSLHTKLCKLPVALRSWNISWNLQSKIALAMLYKYMCVFF